MDTDKQLSLRYYSHLPAVIKPFAVTQRRWYQSRVHSKDILFKPNESLQDIVKQAISSMHDNGDCSLAMSKRMFKYCSVWVDGVKIERERWHYIYPRYGAHIHIYHTVKGGGSGGGDKNILATIGMIVLTVVAAVVSYGTTAALTASMGAGLATVAGGVAGSAVMLVGSLLLNQLFPQAKPSLGAYSSGDDQSRAYSLNGQNNSANINGTIPIIYGHHKFVPPLASRSWTSWEGDTQYFHMCVLWGQENLDVSSIRIGDTSLENFSNVEHLLHTATTGNDLKIFPKTYIEQDIGASLDTIGEWASRSLTECNGFIVDIQFNGLIGFRTDGQKAGVWVPFWIQYRSEDAEWTTLFKGEIYGKQQTLKVSSFKKEGLPLGEYEVRIQRYGSTRYATDHPGEKQDSATWAITRSIVDVEAFETTVPWTVSELRIQAHEQMSGYVSQLNAILKSKCRDWDKASQKWIYRVTNNPSSLMLYTLTSEHTLAKPYADSRIDLVAFQEFHEWCEEKGYTMNFIADTSISLWERLVQIATTGRGAPSIIDGKWSVIIDRGDKTPKQLFTPRNSWGCAVDRTFPILPHALRVTFIDSEADFIEKQQYVFSDGYNRYGTDGKKRATDIVEWDFPGVTTWDKVHRAARRFLAATMHRPLTISLSCDWEYLVSNRGDLVGVSHVVLLNEFSKGHRITTLIYEIDGELKYFLDGDDLPKDILPIGLRLDETMYYSTPSPTRYGIAIRRQDSIVIRYELIPEYGQEVWDLFFAEKLTATNAPNIGEICSVGYVGEEMGEYLIASITPNADRSAELSLVPYAITEIEASENSEIPKYEPVIAPNTIPTSSGIKTPKILQIQSDEGVMLGASIRMVIICSPPLGQDMSQLVYQAEITNKTIDIDGQQSTEIRTKTSSIGENTLYIDNVSENDIYEVKIRLTNVSTGATSSFSSSQTHKIVGRQTPPPPPSALYADGNILKIEQLNRPVDVVGHVVYIGMNEQDTIESSKQVTNPYTTTGNYDLTQYASRTRVVYVKTIDSIGLLSEAVMLKINLGDLPVDNVLFEISEKEKNWSGQIAGGEINSDNDLSGFTTQGYYPADDNDGYYPSDSTSGYYPSTKGSRVEYIYTVDILDNYLGGNLIVNPILQSGEVDQVEYRVFSFPAYYPADDNAGYYPADDNAGYYPANVSTEWQMMPDKIPLINVGRYQIKVTSRSDSLAVFDDIKTIIDVADKEQNIQDLEILADGTTRIPIKQDYFHAIKNVQITLQHIEGLTAVHSEYVPRSEIIEGKYVKEGVLIWCFDNNQQLTKGSVDVTVKGY